MKSQLLNYEMSLNSNPEMFDIINNIKTEQTLTLRKIVHEINNVLCLINSSLQIIESSHPETKNFKYWNTTMGDVNHLINLMSDISSLNHCDNINLDTLDIKLLISDIIDSFISNSKYSNINFKLESDKNLPMINADKTKLKQVFINIIKNALEAFDIDSTNPTVHISIVCSSEMVQININDNGCGISPEHIESIFNPMVSYKSDGTGLGLPISKKIIDAHNGTISVSSSLHSGTTFNISLPID
ncbi:MAG: GHKL domain-containing protein [Lachnospiraceae bacterium]|nr:GHKL domain-containing protein [Lachnospiraceae bacterium]